MSAPVSGPIALGALELAALLCSRVCHDLISPVGAIVNGIEVMEEDKDEETKTFALDLIKKSARAASAKLQFCRLAFGASGAAGAQIDVGDAENAARGILADNKATLVWNLQRGLMPKNRVKLVLNMLLIAMAAIPRGGTLTVDPLREGDAVTGFRITAAGTNARLTQTTCDLMAGSPAETVDAHAVQPVYAGILARDCGLTIAGSVEGEVVTLTAR